MLGRTPLAIVTNILLFESDLVSLTSNRPGAPFPNAPKLTLYLANIDLLLSNKSLTSKD